MFKGEEPAFEPCTLHGFTQPLVADTERLPRFYSRFSFRLYGQGAMGRK